jgi:tellurite resistance protein TehA-like permease
MSLFSLLVLLFIIAVAVVIIKAIINTFKRSSQSPNQTSGFPTFSIAMLSISLILLIVGTWMSLQVSDAIGGALATLSGFFGMFESHVRHKREAVAEKVTEEKDALE